MTKVATLITGCNKQDQAAETSETKEASISVRVLDSYGEYKPKLWVIEKESTKIYLFGSIHVGVDDMYPFPDYVLDAFNDSSVLAVENDIVKLEKDHEYLKNAALQAMDMTPIKNRLAINEFNDLKSVLNGYDFDIEASINGNFKPLFYYMSFTELMVQKTKFDYEKGVDKYLLKKAKEENMEIKDIEDPLYIYKNVFALPYETQIFLLNDAVKSIKNGEEGEEEIEPLVKAWINGEIMEYNEQEKEKMKKKYTQKELEYFEEFDKVMENDRNVIMVDKIIEYLETDQVHFYVVGSLHYCGDHGILELLKKKGYETKEITP